MRLAQNNNIDESSLELLARTDRQMLDKLCFKDYFKYIVRGRVVSVYWIRAA
ncbi:protein of unknown function [Vibrio tapetis subsp. tapetis]|uniref:Uncharacterized protein n=1 Tax=Vibrio tapetis subsp. tapetis TaxID=1671868 RepID=A0A2N8ZGB5_9VIBR|nr:protein of unknown function [Vibrio tapetis subsp. tapetis]